MIRSGGSFTNLTHASGAPRPESALSIGLKSMTVALTNPKAYLFFSALLPQFVDPAQPQASQFVVLAIVFSVTEFAIMFAYALVGARAIRFVTSRAATWLERSCGGALLMSAASLAFVNRASAN